MPVDPHYVVVLLCWLCLCFLLPILRLVVLRTGWLFLCLSTGLAGLPSWSFVRPVLSLLWGFCVPALVLLHRSRFVSASNPLLGVVVCVGVLLLCAFLLGFVLVHFVLLLFGLPVFLLPVLCCRVAAHLVVLLTLVRTCCFVLLYCGVLCVLLSIFRRVSFVLFVGLFVLVLVVVVVVLVLVFLLVLLLVLVGVVLLLPFCPWLLLWRLLLLCSFLCLVFVSLLLLLVGPCRHLLGLCLVQESSSWG